MLDRYKDRPDESFLNGRCNSVNLLCYAEFLHYYYLEAKPQDNDWQPVELSDNLLENNFSNEISPSVIQLMTCNDKLKCRKVPSVLRLFTPNKDKDYELYVHYLLMLYYPFRKESDLKNESPPSYTNKLAEVDVSQIVNENRQKVEPYADLVDKALIQHNIEVLHRENQSIAGESGLTDTGNIEETTGASENTIRDIPFHSQVFNKMMLKLAPIFDH